MHHYASNLFEGVVDDSCVAIEDVELSDGRPIPTVFVIYSPGTRISGMVVLRGCAQELGVVVALKVVNGFAYGLPSGQAPG